MLWEFTRKIEKVAKLPKSTLTTYVIGNFLFCVGIGVLLTNTIDLNWKLIDGIIIVIALALAIPGELKLR